MTVTNTLIARWWLVDFALGALVQFISYTNLVVNIRSIAHAQIEVAIATDAAASAIGYFIIRRVSQGDNLPMMFGMMLGGGAASWVGIVLTRAWG